MATDPPFVVDEEPPLGIRVRCTERYWELITTVKHPVMRGRLEELTRALTDPDQIRRSVRDPDVLLFCRPFGPRWLCAVVLRLGTTGYVITAYPADKLKRGDLVWTR